MTAKVDILIPFHNTRIEWMEEALRSVCGQTFPYWKAIAVNDGSSAESTAALKALIRRLDDPRISYIETPNRGPSAARNAAIRSSDSEYLAILDSDDAWYPCKLTLQVEFLNAHPEIALVHAQHDVLFPDGSRRPGAQIAGINELSQEELIARVLKKNIVGHGEALFRRSAAEAAGLYDEELRTVEDKDLLLRMLLKGHRYFRLDETVYLYRWHAGNSTKNVEAQRDGRLKLVEKMDRLLRSDSRWARLPWSAIRREMLSNVWRQVVEGYLDRRDYRHALWYALSARCGWSMYTGKLAVKAVFGLIGLQPHG